MMTKYKPKASSGTLLHKIMCTVYEYDKSCTCCGPTELGELEDALDNVLNGTASVGKESFEKSIINDIIAYGTGHVLITANDDKVKVHRIEPQEVLKQAQIFDGIINGNK